MDLIKPIIYTSIEEKNIIESENVRGLSPHESLIHCLNVMDFYRALGAGKEKNNSDDGIEWIVLKFRDDK